MSYQVLARKSRPRNFEQVVGQKPVVRTLQNGLAQDRVAHAMIFSGVRGVGKTTLARIMAKAINCVDRQESEPCNNCQSCTEINNGSSVDLVEIDGASNRGIQEIRELKENIRFLPTNSRFKIIIIDEVHMLTAEAFNALLKTLEEPPAHVYFMFATTELHKVPVTILSRCQRYELKRIDSRELSSHFNMLAQSEQVEIEPAALAIIVREAGGSVRDGLSLLDQVFSYCGSRVTLDDVTDMLGLVNHKVISDIAEALLASDLAGALEQLDRVYEYGMDVKRFINDLLSWYRTLVITALGGNNSQLLDLPDELLVAARQCTDRYPGRTLVLMFNILMEELEKAGYSAQPRFALEMAFIKAVQVNEIVPVTSLLGRLDEVLAGVTVSASPPAPEESGAQSDQAEPETPLLEQPQEIADKTSPEPLLNGDGSAPEKKSEQEAGALIDSSPDTVTVSPAPDEKENVKPLVSTAEKEQGKYITRNVRQHWNEFIEYVRDRRPWMASALQVAAAVHLEGSVLNIQYADPAECRLLKNRENITPLTEFALDFFQENFRIQFTLPDSDSCEVDPDNGVSPLQERQALANDTLVLTAVDVFNGEVGDIRVGPRFRQSMAGKPDETDTSPGSGS